MAKKDIVPAKSEGKKNAIATNASLPPMPDFLRGGSAEERGVAELAKFVQPPRMMIIQDQAKDKELKNEFGTGACIIMPQKLCIASLPRNAKGTPEKYGEDFDIVPIFYYTEWVHWADLDSSGDKILGRTLDPEHLIARRAKRKDTRKAEDGSRYVEHMNFVCVFEDFTEELTEPALISFAKGEHKTGRAFSQLIHARRGAFLYGCRFQACVEGHGNEKGDWYGLRIGNHPEAPWVSDEKTFAFYKASHEYLLDIYRSNRLSASYDVADVEGAVGADVDLNDGEM